MKRFMHCPFCGETEGVRLYNESRGVSFPYNHCVVCDGCGLRGPTEESHVSKDTAREAAIDSWNKRISHDEDISLRTAFALGG